MASNQPSKALTNIKISIERALNRIKAESWRFFKNSSGKGEGKPYKSDDGDEEICGGCAGFMDEDPLTISISSSEQVLGEPIAELELNEKFKRAIMKKGPDFAETFERVHGWKLFAFEDNVDEAEKVKKDFHIV